MTDKELNELHTRMGGTPTRPTYNESKVTPVISPPPREWVGLTDDEIEKIWYQIYEERNGVFRAIEAKLKELNT
jgi:hypothetical protein